MDCQVLSLGPGIVLSETTSHPSFRLPKWLAQSTNWSPAVRRAPFPETVVDRDR
jgi:hypothetical protein